MPSVSCKSLSVRQPGAFPQVPDTPASIQPQDHACETQRMKDYSHQRRFQAPVADDFVRGMLAPGQAFSTDDEPLKPFPKALSAVFRRISALWQE